MLEISLLRANVLEVERLVLNIIGWAPVDEMSGVMAVRKKYEEEHWMDSCVQWQYE